MSAKSPRARRSRMCRSVSSYGARRGVDADRVEPELRRPSRLAAPSRFTCEDQCAAREGDPDPRGRRPRGARATRTRPIPEPGDGEVLVRAARGVAEPSRRLDPQGPARRCRSRASSAPTAQGRRGARDGVTASSRERVVINPGVEAGRRITSIGEHTRRHARRADRRAARLTSTRSPTASAFEEAAAFPLVFETAYRMLVTRARLQTDEWVLVWGIGSGVATAALAIAKALGARVDRHLVERREARAGARARRRRRRRTTRRRRGRRRQGGDRRQAPTSSSSTSARRRGSARSTSPRREGRIVVCGATSGPNPPAALHRIWWKQLTILGSTMGTRADFEGAYDLVACGQRAAGRRPRLPARGRRGRARAAGGAASSSARSCCGFPG